jgi:hypothetical protein
MTKRILAVLFLPLVAVFAVVFLLASQSRSVSAEAELADPRVQVAHLAPFAMDPNTVVTVTIDGAPALPNVAYGDSTAYISLPAGPHLIEIYPAGSPTPAITGSVDLVTDTDYTVIAIGDGANQALALKVLVDDNTAPAAGNFKLRLGHLAPFAAGNATADVRLQDGTAILTDVNFADVASYLELPAGTYDLKITTPGGETTLIDPAALTFADGDIVSAFATGDGVNQPLGVFALPSDAAGFFTDLAAYLQVAHLAPFAMDPGTAVTVTVDGAAALTNFAFGDSTGYIPLTAGSHLVEIYPAGAVTPAITGSVDLAQAMEYTAIAIGDGANQPLELLALVDDNTPPADGNFKLRLGHLAPFMAGNATADIRLQDGTPVLTDVNYADVAPYLELTAGTYDLKITNPGGSITLIDPLPAYFGSGEIVSAFAVGGGTTMAGAPEGMDPNQPLDVYVLPAGMPGSLLSEVPAYLQVAHLAPFAMDPGTAVTVTVDGGAALTDFSYGDSTGYIPLTAGAHYIEIFPAGSVTPAITGSVDLAHNGDYTAIASGDGVNQPLALQVLVDDNAAPAAGSFKLRLGHLAPFAAGNATADIRLQDGTPVLTDVNYADVAPYLELPAGTYDLKITTPGGGTTLIDPLPVTFAAGDILSAFATGEGVNQPLGVFALPAGVEGFFLPLNVAQLYLPLITK